MPITDEELLAELDRIGEYDISEAGSELAVAWTTPNGLPYTPLRYSLLWTVEDENGRRKCCRLDN
jgi:hypothetical protein